MYFLDILLFKFALIYHLLPILLPVFIFSWLPVIPLSRFLFYSSRAPAGHEESERESEMRASLRQPWTLQLRCRGEVPPVLISVKNICIVVNGYLL